MLYDRQVLLMKRKPDRRRSPPKIDIPKFENSYLSDVSKYLDLFENVVKQNQSEEAVWPLALRTAVIGTN